MRMIALVALALTLVAGCATTPEGTASPRGFSSPTLTGTWDFTVTSEQGTRTFTFELTTVPANTCISGQWYKVRAEKAYGQTKRPAYRLENGALEILLVNDICDSYTSFLGSVSGETFEGAHVSYGMSHNEEHGKVRGRRRR